MAPSIAQKFAYWRRWLKRHAFVFGRGFSLARLINFVIVEASQRLTLLRAAGKPWSLFIDPVNTCVLRCPLCGTGRGEVPRERKVLSYEDFVRYIEPLTPYLYHVKLFNYGEPFLNPRLHDMIRFLHDRNITTQVNSNLNVLTPEQAEAMILSGLDRLVVSFDGLSQESYSSYRRGGDVAVVKRCIDMVNEAKNRLGRSNPALVLQFLVTRHNEHEYEAVREYAGSVNAEFFPQPITLDPANSDQTDAWLPSNDAYTHYDRTKGIKKKERPDRYCGFLWNDPVINVDGGVSPCCHLFYKSTDFGSLEQESFGTIWNNGKFRAARRIFREKCTASKEPVCARCVDVRAFTDAGFDLVNENRTNDLR